MQWNVFHIEAIANELNNKLQGKILSQCFSTSKEDLFFVFDTSIVLKLSFYKGQCYFHFPEANKLPKKNRLNQFQELVNTEVSSVWSYPFDRAFCIDFTGSYKLCFYLFGRFSQISLYKSNEYTSNFPKHAKPITDRLQVKDILIPRTFTEAKENFQWLEANDIDLLEKSDYDHAANQKDIWDDILTHHRTDSWGIKTNGKYRLVQWNKECASRYENILDAIHDISSLVISKDSFESAKQKVLSKQKQQVAALEKRKKSALANLKAVERAAGYKEKADLLMANMHQIVKGQKSIRLLTFDGQSEVEIKLDPSKTSQEIAQKFYKKAKNEKLRISYLNISLKEVTEQLDKAINQLVKLEAIQGMKELKPYIKSDKSKENKERLPYKRFEIDGFEVRVGKSAKDNDELLRAFSSSQDYWFHAKSVSGSHVILRLNKLQKPSEQLIEKVASIAAYYSKSKNEELARVIYTFRKFVRKPRNAAPGSVFVENEKSILVKPQLELN